MLHTDDLCYSHSLSIQDCFKAVQDFKSVLNRNISCGTTHNLVVSPVNKLVYDYDG